MTSIEMVAEAENRPRREAAIAFHTSLEGCIFVPELRWKTDIKRESLRLALELAFKNPLAAAQQRIVNIGPQKLEHREAA